MLGWGLAVATLGLLVSVVASLVTLPLGDGNPVRAGITSAVAEAFTAYSTIALAVIYESQRRRSVLLSPVPVPGLGSPAASPVDPSTMPDPLDPPPPPAGWS